MSCYHQEQYLASHLQTDVRHEDVLHNLGISGRNFSEQNEALVTEMMRKFLDYSKSARLEAANLEIADRRHTESEPMDIRMTTDGFPIIPKLVMEKELRKAEWEKLLRLFLTQHYCELALRFDIDTIGMISFRSSNWTEDKTGTLHRYKSRYRKLYPK